MPRFRVRTLMVAVGVVALLLGSMGPVGRCYRRWSYHRSEAAMLGRLERAERLNHAREIQAASDRGKIRASLMNDREFTARDAGEQERIIDNAIEYHRHQARMSLAAAGQWAEKRRDHETAALWCWDPLAPDVP
jgi:hypothetical protein